MHGATMKIFNRMFLESTVIHQRIQNSECLRQPSRTVQAPFKKRYTEMGS